MNSRNQTTFVEGTALTPEGLLLQTVWRYNGEPLQGERIERDVTRRAEEFLFEGLSLRPGVVLRSVFLLLQACPALCKVFRRFYANELLDEALGPTKPCHSSAGIEPGTLEYAAVYRVYSRHSGDRSISGVAGLQFQGLGFVQTEDVIEHGRIACPAGSRERYGFSLSSVRDLLDVPLRVDTELAINEADSSVDRFWEKSERLRCSEVQLGEFLQAILRELSWHGTAEQRESVRRELCQSMAEVEAGTARTSTLEEVLSRLMERVSAKRPV